MIVKRVKLWVGNRLTTIILFVYGLVVGTSAPILLSRCSSGSCGNCAGFCGLALAALPPVLFFTFKSRIRLAGQNMFARIARRR
jgi:hypothetical protein